MTLVEQSIVLENNLDTAVSRFNEVALKFLNHAPRRLAGTRPLQPMNADFNLDPIISTSPDIVISGAEETPRLYRSHISIPLNGFVYQHTEPIFTDTLARFNVLTHHNTLFRLSYQKSHAQHHLKFLNPDTYLRLAIADLHSKHAILIDDSKKVGYGIYEWTKKGALLNRELFDGKEKAEVDFLSSVNGFIADLASFLIEGRRRAIDDFNFEFISGLT